jgi:hypothetical protein
MWRKIFGPVLIGPVSPALPHSHSATAGTIRGIGRGREMSYTRIIVSGWFLSTIAPPMTDIDLKITGGSDDPKTHSGFF